MVLLAVGLLHLRRDPSTTTMTALAPGLGLALRADPAVDAHRPGRPPRAAARAGLPALVLAGARLGWTAPVALGSVTGAVLVLWLAAPYVGEAVPRWVLIGGAGRCW